MQLEGFRGPDTPALLLDPTGNPWDIDVALLHLGEEEQLWIEDLDTLLAIDLHRLDMERIEHDDLGRWGRASGRRDAATQREAETTQRHVPIH